MALNVSAWAIRHPLPPLVIAAAVCALGYLSFSKLPVTRMPNVDVPLISVTIAQFGAAPAELESQVTRTVEDAVSGVAGANHITSGVVDGISSTTIEFRLGTDTDRALNDVKDAVTRVRGDLPRTISEPMVQRVDISGLPILTYAAIAPGKPRNSFRGSSRTSSLASYRAFAASQASSESETSSERSGCGSIRFECRELA